jgi:ribosomal protein S12 methylthiotransferase
MDAIGVFGYSDEEGTEAVRLDHHLALDLVEERRTRIADLADELVGQRAEERVGSVLSVLVDEIDTDSGSLVAVGRAAHQGPEVDGVTQLGPDALVVGDLVEVLVTGTDGVDLRGVVLDRVREPVAVR